MKTYSAAVKVTTGAYCPNQACTEKHSEGARYHGGKAGYEAAAGYGLQILPPSVMGAVRQPTEADPFPYVLSYSKRLPSWNGVPGPGQVNGIELLSGIQGSRIQGSEENVFLGIKHLSHIPADKANAFYVCSPVEKQLRSDHSCLWKDFFYVDCDNVATYDSLKAWALANQLGVTFFESSSSVRARQAAADAGVPQPEVTSWHAVFPLSKRLVNAYQSPGKAPPSSPEWIHYKREEKSKHSHVTGYLSWAAGLPGFAGHCGLDLTVNGFSIPRFVGSVQRQGGLLPRYSRIPGNALDFEAMATHAGFRPSEMVVKKTSPGLTEIEYLTPGGLKRTKCIFSSNSSGLFDYVRQNVSCHTLLDYLGVERTSDITADGKAYYYCPVHNEYHNKQAFHVFPPSDGRALDQWNCFGDCNGKNGDVISLASHLGQGLKAGQIPGTSMFGPALWIAKTFGLDVSQFLARSESKIPESLKVLQPVEGFGDSWDAQSYIDTERDKQEYPASYGHIGEYVSPYLVQPEPVKEEPKALPYPRLESWAKHYLSEVVDLRPIVRAISFIVLKRDIYDAWEIRKKREEEKNLAEQEGRYVAPELSRLFSDPARIVASLLPVLTDSYTKESVEGTIISVAKIIQDEGRCAGGNLIRAQLGNAAMSELMAAIGSDLAESSELPKDLDSHELLRYSLAFKAISLVGRKRLHKMGKKFNAKLLQRAIEAPPPPVPGALPSKANTEAKVYAAETRKIKGRKNACWRPMGCRAFEHHISTSLGRDVGKSKLVCMAILCPYCSTIKLMGEAAIAERKQREHVEARKATGKFGGLFAVSVECETTADYDNMRSCIAGETAAPKLISTGFNRGRPRALIVVEGTYTADDILNDIACWGYVRYPAGAPEFALPKKHTYGDDYKRAMFEIQANKIGINSHAIDLLRAIKEDDSPEEEALVTFLSWIYRKQSIVARNGSLPWATQKELKAEKQSEDSFDLAEGEHKIYKLYHPKTDTTLGIKDRPFTIDEAIAIGRTSPVVKQRLLDLRNGVPSEPVVTSCSAAKDWSQWQPVDQAQGQAMSLPQAQTQWQPPPPQWQPPPPPQWQPQHQWQAPEAGWVNQAPQGVQAWPQAQAPQAYGQAQSYGGYSPNDYGSVYRPQDHGHGHNAPPS